MHSDVAASFHKIGLTNYSLKNLEEALKFQNESLKIRKELFGELHSDIAKSLNNIGFTYFELGKFQ